MFFHWKLIACRQKRIQGVSYFSGKISLRVDYPAPTILPENYETSCVISRITRKIYLAKFR
ncbi:hypothetical protein WN51_12536 [Melipona quadrifasciata]|uniref:Uncharacterized protein n=1 Tax=Melipona quadrifasciata TaxID=166423 RepID=A0A0M9A545_9HYME|nr:hypothetical protein WN51_12536 [Melipona quadrifasciata]